MTERLRRGQMRADRYEDKRRRSPAAIIFILVLIAAIIGICIFTYVKKNTTYTSYREVSTITAAKLSDSSFVQYLDGYLRYSKDGAEAADSNCSPLWNVTYSIKKPIIDVSDNCAVVADYGGRVLYIMDGTGSVNPIQISESIVDVKVASQAVAAVWTNTSTDDHIYMYKMDGTMLLDIETKTVKDGFPLAIELSPDGRKLITSYIKIGEESECWVTMYNLGDVGQNYSDKIVGSFSYGESFVPEMRFIGNDHLCVFTEKGISLYKLLEIPELVKEIAFDTTIKSIFSDQRYIGIAAENSNGTDKYRVSIYDTAGKSVSEFSTSIEYTEICFKNDEIILYGQGSCVIYKLNGDLKFKTGFDDSVRYMFTTNNEDSYILIQAAQVETIKLITAKEEEAEKTDSVTGE